MIERNAHFVSLALEGSPVTLFFQNVDGGFDWFENPLNMWKDISKNRETGVLPADKEPFTVESRLALEQAKNESLIRNRTETVVVKVNSDIARDKNGTFLKITVRAVLSDDGELLGYLGSSVDISAEKQREETLRTLLMEVAHRSKNILAMVLSLSVQTSKHASSIEGFMKSFIGRVQSLVKSQNVVTDADWSGARLHALVDHQVREVVPEKETIMISGTDPLLSPNASTHVGLALHELVNNALVHGALSSNGGVVNINCCLEKPVNGKPLLVIEWSEQGSHSSSGGSVHALAGERKSSKNGFGRKLLETVVPMAVGGEGFLKLENDSVYYRLTVADTDFT